MNFDLHTASVALTESLRSRLQQRLAFALGRFADAISHIAVSLKDTNGPRGGVDQCCRIRVHLDGTRTPVIVESTQTDLGVAIDTAADRIGHTLARVIDRQATRSRMAAAAPNN